MVKVYSNCEEATLFLNGLSSGPKKRNSQDFPAAGLCWKLKFNKGENTIRVIARKGTTIVEDSIHFQYQTDQWGKPAKMTIERIGETDSTLTVRVQLLDEHGIPCLDATDWIRFGLTGDGKLIDDQGTSTGSRYVQAYNGQAMISLKTRGGHSVVSAQSGELTTVFVTL